MNLQQHARAGQPTASNSIQTTPAALILLLGVLLMVMVSACSADPALESGSSSLFGVDDKRKCQVLGNEINFVGSLKSLWGNHDSDSENKGILVDLMVV